MIEHQRPNRLSAEEERRLVIAAERYERFWNISPDLAIIVDGRTGRIVDANPAWLRTFGWSLEEVTSRPFLAFVHPDDRDRTDDVRQELVDGLLLLNFENRYVTKDGRYRTLDWSALDDGTLIYAYARDMTERRELEREFRHQKDLTERMIEASPAAISYLNRDLRYEWANARHLETFGLTLDGVIGKGLAEVYGEVGAAQIRPFMQAVLDTGKPYYARSFPFESRVDGKVHQTYWDFSYQPLVEDGQVVGVMALADEVSDRVEREQLQQQRIHDLEAANVHKEQFLGILSHELRTPLNAILGFGSILADGVAGKLTGQQVGFVEKILTASDHMLGLVNDLLDLSRVQAGKFSVRPGEVALRPELMQVLVDEAGAAIAKGVTLVNRLPAELPAVRGEAQRIRQILDNLVANAIKYTASGGSIIVCASAEADVVRIEVEDTGIGISAKEQGRIFDTFTQVDMSNIRSRGGVGLGLSIVKALVEAHGGRFGVESRPGLGSTFWFTLPRVAPAR